MNRHEESAHQAAAKSLGIVIGRVQKLVHGRLPIPERHVAADQRSQELDRFRKAVEETRQELEHECKQLERLGIHDPMLILEVHRMLLADPELNEKTVELIEREGINAEWALRRRMDEIQAVFASIEDPYLRERSEDIEQVGSRIMQHLQGRRALPELQPNREPTVLVSDDFSPIDVVSLWRFGAAGLIAEQGGANAHSIIVARGIGLPMLVGAHGLMDEVQDGDDIILDAELGRWVCRPSKALLAQYAVFKHALDVVHEDLMVYASRPSRSADGHAMALMANLEFVEEAAMAQKVGAEGIGLFRSEFMFVNARQLPDAPTQARYYRRLIHAVDGKPVIIRLLDIGGDKPLLFRAIAGHEYAGANPALGLRGIRLLKQWPDILDTQLTAILMAAQEGQVKVLVPMVATVEEMEMVRERVERICRRHGWRYDVPVGAMIEVPAAVMIADELASVSDFFSIGTNDLLQYTLAADRNDEEAAALYPARHPAIIKMIEHTAKAGRKHDIPVAVCGELAADDEWTETFLNLDIDALSMSAHHILGIRKHLARLNYRPEHAGGQNREPSSRK
ncbi:MAG: phosphoenolpyruvate--protein phosphotransferase [Zetaproteobacteria bacterium]|nr:MAG: phosphoenolpyruvate--protein phosphotransferase [Zetaproteobacteria bacterium]